VKGPILRFLFLSLTSLAWRCENLSVHHPPPSPSYPSHHCPFTPVEPGHGVDLFEDDYLFLPPAADSRMDPELRPRPASPVAFASSVTFYNSTTRLNDGIFTVHRFSVATSARLRKSVFFDSTYTAEYLTTHRDFFFICTWNSLFFFFFFFFVAWGGRGSVKEGRIVCTTETQ
jgi:hypothetical protein